MACFIFHFDDRTHLPELLAYQLGRRRNAPALFIITTAIIIIVVAVVAVLAIRPAGDAVDDERRTQHEQRHSFRHFPRVGGADRVEFQRVQRYLCAIQ